MTTPLKVRIGAIVWCLYVWFFIPNLRDAHWAAALVLLAALVLVPMAWCLARDANDTGASMQLRRVAMGLQLPAALLLTGSFLLPPGVPALLCALPWAIALGCMAVAGVLRVSRRHLVPLAELTRDAGLIYAVVGGVWLLADRGGMHPLGFDSIIVILTAVHFHYAGLVLPIVAGLALGRQPGQRAGQLAAWGVIVGVPLVAAGITASQAGWGPGVELLATLVLMLAGWGVAWMHFRLAAREAAVPGVVRMFWAVAACVLFAGMLLAGIYGSRSLGLALPWLDIPWMRALHGTLNSLGFALFALLGWCRAGRRCCCGG
jgi:hypothetical protein